MRSSDKLCGPMNLRQLLKKNRFVIPSYDYCQASDVRQNQAMQSDSAARGLPRRDFLKVAGLSAAALALPSHAIAGIIKGPATPGFDFKRLANTHDLLSLPDWGPYSKKYFGVSHIPDLSRGLCFDWSIFPVPTKGSVKLPSVMDKTGVHPWEASGDASFYSLRTELIWKDQFYCDMSFFPASERGRLARIEFVNQTADPQEVALHCLTQLVFPPVKELTAEPIRLCEVQLPPDAVWVHALDYMDLRFAKPRPTDNLCPDGKWRGEERRHDSVGGSVIAQKFGEDAGDTVNYRFHLKKPLTDAASVWRFLMSKGESVTFQMDGDVHGEVVFHGSGEFETAVISLGQLSKGEHEFNFSSLGGAAIALNGFAIVERKQAGDVHFVGAPWHPVPETETVPNGLILKYEDAPNYYGFALGLPVEGHRSLKWRDLDAAFGAEPGPNTRQRIFGDRRRGRAGDPDSLFINAFSKPFTIAPNSRQVIYGFVVTGSQARVREDLARFDPHAPANERHFIEKRKTSVAPVGTAAGESFKLSQQLMAAVTLTNLVYPVYTQRKYIRHYSPGRSWDCLYTWDAGFIGLGLLELNLNEAVELLNTYLAAPGSQSAFIHHGSPVPVQIYLFHELWNRTQSRELLEYFYPRVRQYHRFLAGRLGSSTTRRHQDKLICTWDYFYNSGGWDDYPPQKYVHQQKLEASVAPVINSAHTIRCAKLLRATAAALGKTEDFQEYDEDIAVLAASLQKYSWDEHSGYFGYVTHDEAGMPTGILRDENGINFNMGLDGIYPLTAGICSPEQEQKILDRLFSQKNLWMDIGITTVDQSAPYFSATGYWNGSVWFAHQWFFWKTMLDLGRGDLANRIAQTGLNIWRQVTGATYDCMEHFMPTAPYGAGWHQFSSLSSPALSWFASLYTPGRLTCGFETLVEDCQFSRNNRRLRARLRPTKDAKRRFSVLACMNGDSNYQVRWNGKPAEFQTVHDGLLQIQLSPGRNPGELVITHE